MPNIRAEIHQALFSQFSLLTEFSLEILPIQNKDSRVVMLVNLYLGYQKEIIESGYPVIMDIGYVTKELRARHLVWYLNPLSKMTEQRG